jgi:threonyl-tRNA synthetase
MDTPDRPGTIAVSLPDGTSLSLPRGATAGEVLARVSPGRAGVVAARVDGREVDLSRSLEGDARLEFISLDSPEGLDTLRHSTAHVMAQAVMDLFPGTKFSIGPSIEHGFYYDFDSVHPFTPEDLEAIQRRMAEIVAADHPFQRVEMSREDALDFFRGRQEDYKLELLREIPDGTVSLYRQGSFTDLCRGPHLPSTGQIPAFRVLSVAGAYWRGDERNRMLQRIYGTAFETPEKLAAHLALLEEAKKRDHRRLGKQLDLFSIHDEVGAGLVIYHPRGAMLRSLLEDFEKSEHLKRGYLFVRGPELLRTSLWMQSGHYDNYQQNMYFTDIEGEGYGLKPMNCLAHMLIYKSAVRSYRDLPLRYFELGTVHRHEKTGVLHGLLRVREFTQDDAHILCTPDQVQEEIVRVIDFVHDVMGIFGFPYSLEVSTRPEKSIGSDQDWERATEALFFALRQKGLPHEVNHGDGAFYGPKIDVKLKDALGRQWQCATIQCDFTLPERFDLTYVGPDGQKHRPVMLHRVILGSLERFISVLIEHYGGAFPPWLAPVQATVMNITGAQDAYSRTVADRLRERGFRVDADLRNEKIGFKIREGQLQKVPYMLVVGNREMAEGSVAVRSRDQGDLGAMGLDEFAARLEADVREKR